ncbi:Sfi1 spindle body protein-domain-containing protein [Limtongia smithiae]|uniref:Sfi1 spindle body protein-domain-containing protein n=1 Tax=Limtongia smithiae TaxID=1125753 RepID=UPI0034CF786A
MASVAADIPDHTSASNVDALYSVSGQHFLHSLLRPASDITDINVLRTIVQLALRSNAADANSFITVFRCYEIVLRRRKIDSSRDTFYFKLLVKLCRTPGVSWADKFNNLLRDISSSLVQRRQPELNALSDEFLSEVLRRKFRLWRARSAQHQHYIHSLRRAAVKYDKSTLTLQAFRLWRARLHILEDREVKAEHHYRVVTLHGVFTYWKGACDHAIALETANAKLFQLGVHFRKWFAKALKSAALSDKLITSRAATRTQLLTKFFKLWFYNAYIIRADNYYDSGLLEKCMDVWVLALQNVSDLTDRAEAFSRRITLQRAFSNWAELSDDARSQAAVAGAFHRRIVLRRMWARWTQGVRLKYAARDAVIFIERSLATRVLHTWREHTSMVIVADTQYCLVLTRRYIKRMREQLRARILIAAAEMSLKRKVLCTWVLRERSALLERVMRRRRLALWFVEWNEKTVGRINRDEDAVELVYGRANYRIAMRMLGSWREKAGALAQLMLQAEAFSQQKRIALYFGILMSRFQKIQEYRTSADAYHRASTLKASLTTWKRKIRLRRARRREDALREYQAQARRRLVRMVLNMWLDRTIHLAELAVLADEHHSDITQRRTVTNVFDAWRGKVNGVRVLETRAQELNISRITSTYFKTWHSRSIAYAELEEKADAVYDINSLLRAQSLLRRWNMAALQVGILRDRADVFRSKWRQARVRTLFAGWVDTARERVRLAREEYDEEEAEEEDEGDRSADSNMTIIAPPVYTPTRRPLRGSGSRVLFSGLSSTVTLAPPANTPQVERWARLRNSPMYEGRRRLFATPAPRKKGDDAGRTV